MSLTAVHLCFLPWALGSMHVWSQLISLGLAAAGFVLALQPRGRRNEFSSASPANTALRRLRLFPVFWAGLALVVYIAAQGINPSWRYQSNGDSWWLVPLAQVAGLPSGIDAPFAQANPWRALVIIGSLWLLLCSIWAGFTRRQSFRVLFAVLAGNAFLLSLLGGLQLLTGAREIFWTYLPSNAAFCASFIYPNHAGAYLNLLVALATGFAWWHFRRSRRGLEGAGQSRVFLLFAVGSGAMVVFSTSRTSIVLLLAFIALVAATLAVRLLARPGSKDFRRRLLPLGLALAGFLTVCDLTLQSPRVWARFTTLLADPVSVDQDRALARRAAGEMWRDRWLLGWGAGCFRYGFPLYAQKYPLIYGGPDSPRKYWEHAHDDLLEIPLELGAAGLLPLVAGLGWGAWRLIQLRFWRNSVPLCLVFAGSLALAHAGVDFVFQNPAVLLTWATLLTGALRWAELDDPTRAGPRVRARTEYTPAPGASSPP